MFKMKSDILIKSIDIYTLKIPLKKPIKMAGISVDSAENLFVKITNQNDNYGWGEASSAPTMTGEFSQGMFAAAIFLKNILINKNITSLNDLNILKNSPLYENKGAKSAFEIALLDLIAKENEVPLYKIFSDSKRPSIPIIKMVAGKNLTEEIEDFKKALDDGFTKFKIKVGSNDANTDLNRCSAISQIGFDKCFFSADANEGYSISDAIEFAKNAKDAGISFFEQPISASQKEKISEITALSTVPTCSDEGVHSINDVIEIGTKKITTGLSLKTIKLGGAYEAFKCGERANELGLNVNLSGKVAETSIASLAISHVAQAISQANWDLSITNQYLVADPVSKSLKISNGIIQFEESIGLGTELNLDKASEFIQLSN